jgi:polyvinyl alcohol dehydrogenase (cytochrome)
MKVAIAVAVVAVAGAPVLWPARAGAGADWPVYGHDLANTRSDPAAGPSLSQAGSLMAAWTFASSNGDFTGTPVIAGGTLVAGTNLGTVYALDAVTGKLRWSHQVGAQINGTAAIDTDAPGGATVFVPVAQVGSPRIVALSLATGAVRWDAVLSRQASSDVFASPVFWTGTVYIGTSGPNNDEATARGSVVALDERTGAVRWQTFTVPPGYDGGAVWSTPAIDTQAGRLYVGTGNAYHAPAADTTDSIMALNARTGDILGHFQSTAGDIWELDNPSGGPDYDFGASPNLLSGPGGQPLVGEGSKSGDYWALDRASLRPVWHTSVGPGSSLGGILGSTAYDGARIYGTDATSGQAFALAAGGAEQWASSDGGEPDWTPAAVANGVLYTADPNGYLIARNALTGEVLARLALGTPLTFGGIAVAGRAVYVATGSGPPPNAVPGPDLSGYDANGTIIAFGDTTGSGAAAQSQPSSAKPPHKRRHRRHRRHRHRPRPPKHHRRRAVSNRAADSSNPTFDGVCTVSGVVRFLDPLTGKPAALTGSPSHLGYQFTSGPPGLNNMTGKTDPDTTECRGTLNGEQIDLKAPDAVVAVKGVAELSCAAGANQPPIDQNADPPGQGYLRLTEAGVAYEFRFGFTFTVTGTEQSFTFTNDTPSGPSTQSGSASLANYAPPSTLTDCAPGGSGVRQAGLSGGDSGPPSRPMVGQATAGTTIAPGQPNTNQSRPRCIKRAKLIKHKRKRKQALRKCAKPKPKPTRSHPS